MTLAEKQRSLIEDLNLIPDPQERLSLLMVRSGISTLAADEKSDAYLVRGCVSSVWVTATPKGDTLEFRCDAESPMVKGLVSLLCELYSGATPEEILSVEPTIWEECGFLKMLSPTRLNGLSAVRERIRQLAMHTIFS
jgi:cysteine desulfuration protein SufE